MIDDRIATTANVRVLGRVSDAEKWAALRAADALVLPSRLESLGIVLLEAFTIAQNLAISFNLELDPIPADVLRRVAALAADWEA